MVFGKQAKTFTKAQQRAILSHLASGRHSKRNTLISTDRKGERPREHLKDFKGILQADAYAGFKDLYKPDEKGNISIKEAACWAHARREFHGFWKLGGSEIAKEALERIGALYDIEAQIKGLSAEARLIRRQLHSKPKSGLTY